MDGINLAYVLQRQLDDADDALTSTSSTSASATLLENDGVGRTSRRSPGTYTQSASSTTGTSYTSYGSLPPSPNMTNGATTKPAGSVEYDFSHEAEEIAVGVLQAARAPASGSKGKRRQNKVNHGIGSPTHSLSSGRQMDYRKVGHFTAEHGPYFPSADDEEDGSGSDDDSGSGRSPSFVRGGPRALTKRVRLNAHIDFDDDTPSLRTYWDALFYPEVYMKIFYALRITFLVALPLAILARHPKTMPVFPAHVVLPLWGIVDCKYTVGEQIAQSIMSIQTSVWMMIWGTAWNAMGLLNHHSAWWCVTIFGAFFVSMFGSLRGKRLLVLQTVLILQMENLPGGTELIYPVKVGRDMIMATGFAILQVFFPLRSIAHECDKLMASGWEEFGLVFRAAVTAIWTDDPIQSVVALGKLSSDPLHSVFCEAEPMLFATMYEPWESTLRLELRKERLELMKLCVPRLHSTAATARALVMKRVFNIYDTAGTGSAAAGKKGTKPHFHHRHHHHQPKGGGAGGKRENEGKVNDQSGDGVHSPLSEGSHEPFRDDSGSVDGRKKRDSDTPEYFSTVRRSVSKLFGLRTPPKTVRQRNEGAGEATHKDVYVEPLEETDESDSDDASPLVDPRHHHRHAKNKEMEVIRQSRLRVQHEMEQRLRAFGKTIIMGPLNDFLDKLDDVLKGLGQHLNPRETVELVPFDALQDASAELEAAVSKLHFELLIKSNDPVDAFTFSNTIFFHLSLIVLAERLIEYGRHMKSFDRKRYKSQWARIWEFFFYDWWKGFFNAVPKRLTLATPRDRRILKDSIKLAAAYGVGIMFTEYTDQENVYYFGMAILMGVGWPTAGDTMVASVYRVTGMVGACSIAYMAIWHTNTLTQQIAIALAGTFIALIFRDVPPYSHTAQYCSMLICTALNSAGTKLVLLARIVSNTFTVMCYYAICIFIFPISVLKITHSTEARAIIAIAERFAALTDVMTAPLYPEDPDQADAILGALDIIVAKRADMWALVVSFGEWLPKANAEPSAHGKPYPLAEQKAVHESLRRLASVTDIVCAALRDLHRKGADDREKHSVVAMFQAVVPVMLQIDRRGRVVMQDFLDATARPYEWSVERATRHLSEFLFLSGDLHRAFLLSHRRSTRALRVHFADGVMNRTFAAATKANILEPTAAAAAAAALEEERRQRNSFARPNATVNTRNDTANLSSSGRPLAAADSQILKNASIHCAPGASLYDRKRSTHHTSTNAGAVPAETAPADGVVSGNNTPYHFHTNIADVEEDEAMYGESHPPPVTNESVTATILSQLRRLEDQSTALSPQPLSETSEGSNHGSSTYYLPQPRRSVGSPTTPQNAARNVNNNRSNNPLQDDESTKDGNTKSLTGCGDAASAASKTDLSLNTSFSHVVTNQSMTVKDLEDVLMPIEKQAEDEEYRAFVAKRRNPHFMCLEDEQKLSYDLNSVISLLVAAEIYFAEAEKLVKNMYHINSYAKSQKPLPGTSVWDVNVSQPKLKKM